MTFKETKIPMFTFGTMVTIKCLLLGGRESFIVSCTNCSVACSDSKLFENRLVCRINWQGFFYIVGFKLNVIWHVKPHGNRIAKRHFDIPPTQKMVHGKGKRRSYKSWGRINSLRKNVGKWLDLEVECRKNGLMYLQK